MREYGLVSQKRTLIELHRRRKNEWQVEILTGAEERCVFESVGLTLSVGDVYRNVRFDEVALQQES